jgi:dolichol-phosphate mannosyltransferase
MKKNKILIIIPTFNERENISVLIKQIIETISNVDILVIDDDSPDGTAQEVIAFSKIAPTKINIIVRKGVQGLGGAYTTGFKYGLKHQYDVIITMDADLSHNPDHLPAFLDAIGHYDIVVGSRYIKHGGTINWRIRRILLSWLANKFARFVLGLGGHDLTSGFRAYSRSILETIDLDKIKSNGYSYLVEMLFLTKKKGAQITEIPIIFVDRTMGKSKISKQEIYRGAFTLLRLRFFSHER